jgi:hypothetical protein
MPRPLLPDELRKDIAIKVRFLESEMHLLHKQANIHQCKTISEYIRKLVREDISKTKKSKTLPDIC